MARRILLALPFIGVGCGFFPEVGGLRDESNALADGGGGTSATSGGGSTSTSNGGTSSSSSSSSGDGGNDAGIDGSPATGPTTWTVNVGPNDREVFEPRDLTI